MVLPIDAALTAQFPANSLPYRELQGEKPHPSPDRGKNTLYINHLCSR
jgi:hypothetical protein